MDDGPFSLRVRMLIGGYTKVVITAQAQRAFEASFYITWDVPHECICSTVHRTVATAKGQSDSLGFTWAICVTLDFHLDLWHAIRSSHVSVEVIN